MEKELRQYAAVWEKRLNNAESLGMSEEDVRLVRFTYQAIWKDIEDMEKIKTAVFPAMKLG